jgi:hypothetical protein
MGGFLKFVDDVEERKSFASGGTGYTDVLVRSLVTILTMYVGFWESYVENLGKNTLY